MIDKHWIAFALAVATSFAAYTGNISIAVVCVLGAAAIEIEGK